MLDAHEIEAVNVIMRTLDELEPEARTRVMLYLRGRLDGVGALPPLPPPAITETKQEEHGATRKGKITDIRQMRTDKAPRSDVEMTALVAYYLQDEAPQDERKDKINRSDLEKYFKQAGHPLPKRLSFTLTNAKNAGYLDQVGQGEYRLNAVGYNLVAYSLPPTAGAPRATRRPKRAQPGQRGTGKASRQRAQTKTAKHTRKSRGKNTKSA